MSKEKILLSVTEEEIDLDLHGSPVDICQMMLEVFKESEEFFSLMKISVAIYEEVKKLETDESDD